jgi:sugar phosphate isomerase/epimerase
VFLAALSIERPVFLKAGGGATAGLAAGGSLAGLFAQIAPNWKNQIGIELFTVRNLLTKDYDGTLAKLAAMGYKEVEPADPYNNMKPAEYKAMLDRHGLKMYSTHAAATDGPDLEKELEGHQLMGIKYSDIRAPRPAGARGPGAGPGGPGGAAPGGAPGAGGPQGAPRAPQQRPPLTVESVKRSCEQLNRYGKILAKFGMKAHIHNHAGEFDLLDDGKHTQYDIYLAETDPELVAMQIDIGWASMAGQDVIQMFKKNPGRYELWHVKDA